MAPPSPPPETPTPDSAEAPQPRPARRGRRILRWLRRACLALVLLLLVGYLFRGALLAPVLIGALEDAAQRHAGIELEIAELGGSWFGSVELRGVRTRRAGARTALSSVDLERARAEYSLWGLLRSGIAGLHRLEVQGLRAELDLRRLPPADPDAEPTGLPPAPAALPSVEIAGVRLHVRAEAGTVTVHDLEARVTPGATAADPVALRVGLDAGETAWRGRALAPVRLRLEAWWRPGTWAFERSSLDLRTRETGGGESWLAREFALEARAPALDLEDPAAADLRLSARTGALAWEGLELRSAEASVALRDRRLEEGRVDLQLPDGRLLLEDLAMPLQAGLSLRERIAAADGTLHLETSALPSWLERGDVDPRAMPRLLDAATLHAVKRQAELRMPEGSVRGAAGALRFDGVTMLVERHDGRMVATGVRVPLRFDLERGWGPPGGGAWPACRGRITVALRTPLSLEAPPGAVALVLEELEITAGSDEIALQGPASLSLEPGRGLRLEDFVLATPAGQLALSADLPLVPRGGEADRDAPLQLEATLRDFDWAGVEPWLPQGASPLRSGRATASLTATGTWSQPVLRLRVDGEGWHLRDLPAGLPEEPASFTVAAALEDGTLRVDGTSLQALGARAELSGTWELPLDPAALAAGEDLPLDGALELRAEAASASLAWLEELAPALRPAASSMAVSAELRGTLAQPRGALRGELRELRSAAHELPAATLAWELVHDGARLEVRALRLDASGLRLRVQGDVALGGAADPLPDDGALALDAALELDDPAPWAAVLQPPPGLDLAGGSARVSASLEGTWGAPRITAGAAASLARLGLEGQASLRIATPARRLLAGEPLRLGASEAVATLAVEDLSWLGARAEVVRAQGALRGRLDWSTDGERARWDGELALEEAGMRPAAVGLPAIEGLNAILRVDPERLVLERATGMLGAAPFTLDGTLALSGADGPTLDLALSGDNLLLYRAGGIKLRAHVDLAVRGPVAGAQVSGKVGIVDGRMVKNVDFLRVPLGRPLPPSPGGIQIFALEEPLDTLQFDVEITTPGRFLVDNNVVRGLLRPELRLTGTGAVPLVRGEIYLDDATMRLPATRIKLRQGVVRFLEDDPFRPRLDLRGTMRRYGYDVTMLVTGPYDEPEVLLSSVPPLRERDLVTLVTTGRPPGEHLDAEAAAGQVALYLARDLLRIFFDDESTEADESLLERLEIEVGRDATRQGEETIEGRFRLLEDWLAERDALYVESEKDAYGDVNLGLKWLFRFD